MAGTEREEKKRTLSERIFPVRYDFEGMLKDQAEETAKGTQELVEWLKAGAKEEPSKLTQIEQQADDIRYLMEHRLQEAFSTPFDRQDIYMISRQMDQIVNYSLSTAIEMRAFKVEPEEQMHVMAGALNTGAHLLVKAMDMMHDHDKDAPSLIRQIRAQVHVIENAYVKAMKDLFDEQDAIRALKNREIYHHMRDAGRNMAATVDILHRIIVAMA